MKRAIKSSVDIPQLPTDISEWDKIYRGYQYDLPYYYAQITQDKNGLWNLTMFDQDQRIVRSGSLANGKRPENIIRNANIWLRRRYTELIEDGLI